MKLTKEEKNYIKETYKIYCRNWRDNYSETWRLRFTPEEILNSKLMDEEQKHGD